MRAYAHILYRLARFLAGVPPETLGAAIVFAVEHPGLGVAILLALEHSWLVVVICAVVLLVLKYLVGLLIDEFVAWYLGKMFMIHVWPKLPSGLQKLSQRIEDRILFRWLNKDRGSARETEAAFSRNSKRHPHW